MFKKTHSSGIRDTGSHHMEASDFFWAQILANTKGPNEMETGILRRFCFEQNSGPCTGAQGR